ncbi:MAG: hypothetical protein HFE29_04125 [Clostridia bacterium]|jgi:hypothetical protein|nr:hypothetical protein [Clostridia bacterium]
MNYDEFFDKVYIEEIDKNKAKYYLDNRGICEHIFVAEYLQSLKTEKVTYYEVATAFRYDKRIRRIIYKYIGFLEEYLRAYIINHFRTNTSNLKTTKILSNLLAKYEDLYSAVNQLTFGNLISQVKKLPVSHLNKIFSVNIRNKNLDALVGLRNEVNHNRFLLHNKSLRSCTVGTNNGRSLWANIINLSNLLPEKLRMNLQKEIDIAKEPRKIKFEGQVEWSLIEEIIIDIK